MHPVEELVLRAAADDAGAWTELVNRFAGMVWSVARSVGLSHADAADVSQTTWMRLAEHLDTVRDPSRVGAWLATTARREAIRVSRLGARQALVDPWDWTESGDSVEDESDARLLANERETAVRVAFAGLPDRCRSLLAAVISDPPVPYGVLSVELGMPVGSIGPTRARCLRQLERIIEGLEIHLVGGFVSEDASR